MKTHRKTVRAGVRAGAAAVAASGPTTAPPPRWRALGAQVGVVAAAAAILYWGLASWSDLGSVAAVMRTFPAPAVAAVAGLVLAGLALRAARWQYYVHVLALGIPAGPSLLAFVAGFAFTATPGKAGEIVKSFLLRRRFGARVSQTAGTLVVERVTDLLAVLLLAVAGMQAGVGQEWVLAVSALALAGAIALLLSRRLQDAAVRFLGALPVLGRVTGALPALLESSRALLAPGRLATGLGLAVAAWSCEALALGVVLDALGAAVPLGGAFFAFAAASLLGVLSMLQGGLGGFEASMVLVLGELGAPPAAAVAATLLFRLGTLWAVSLLGLAALGLWLAVFGRSSIVNGGSR